jgi:hypothetical protein
MIRKARFYLRTSRLVGATAGFILGATLAWGQSGGACDLNNDGSVTVVDVQLAVNMIMGVTQCTATVNGSGVCNVSVLQKVANAALGSNCATGVGTTHTVTLNWTPSTSSNVVGYYVYRGTVSGGPYTKLNTTPVPGAFYTDNNVPGGLTYYYVATSVDSNNVESTSHSNEASAPVPST